MEEATELTDTQQLLRAVSPASSRQQQNIHDRHNSELGPPFQLIRAEVGVEGMCLSHCLS
ncbi:hypothetical protein OsI_25339 [Oryza sativa Indica Group]|uniref:Uncharacterized protein n=1 Tax=Oryza sativa subsp. indica TaxID=39946 RepID=B8B8J0_ORYSI|nr:hypothetical protein OsI_25339 [Oryza sativa Indica Group]